MKVGDIIVDGEMTIITRATKIEINPFTKQEVACGIWHYLQGLTPVFVNEITESYSPTKDCRQATPKEKRIWNKQIMPKLLLQKI